jgi:hypothetical protein
MNANHSTFEPTRLRRRRFMAGVQQGFKIDSVTGVTSFGLLSFLSLFLFL